MRNLEGYEGNWAGPAKFDGPSRLGQVAPGPTRRLLMELELEADEHPRTLHAVPYPPHVPARVVEHVGYVERNLSGAPTHLKFWRSLPANTNAPRIASLDICVAILMFRSCLARARLGHPRIYKSTSMRTTRANAIDAP